VIEFNLILFLDFLFSFYQIQKCINGVALKNKGFDKDKYDVGTLKCKMNVELHCCYDTCHHHLLSHLLHSYKKYFQKNSFAPSESNGTLLCVSREFLSRERKEVKSLGSLLVIALH